MKSFLSPERQAKLTKTLTSLEVEPEQIQAYIDNLPDDLEAVDDEMALHVNCVIFCRNIGEDKQALTGLAVLAAIMLEAKSHGLNETDFPKSHHLIKGDLTSHYGLTEEDVIEIASRMPPETLQ
jgi:hypothetical protein